MFIKVYAYTRLLLVHNIIFINIEIQYTSLPKCIYCLCIIHL